MRWGQPRGGWGLPAESQTFPPCFVEGGKRALRPPEGPSVPGPPAQPQVGLTVQPSGRLPRCSGGTVCRGLGGQCLWARRWLFLPAGISTVPLPRVGRASSAPWDARDPPVPSYPYLGWAQWLLARTQTHADAPSAAAALRARPDRGVPGAGRDAGKLLRPPRLPAPAHSIRGLCGAAPRPSLNEGGSAPHLAPAALGRRCRRRCLPCGVPSARRLRVCQVPQIPPLAALPQRQLVPCCSPT